MGWLGSNNNTSTSTTAPTWGEDYLRSLVSRADTASQQPFQPYYGEMVADLNDQQRAAISQLGNVYGQATPHFNYASYLYGNAANSANGAQFAANPFMITANNMVNAGTRDMSAADFSSEALSGFINPYKKDVVDATMAVLDENNQAQSSRLAGRSISGGSFGGDRAGVAQAELARQQNLTRDQTIAGLNSQAFDNAQKMQMSVLDSNAKRQLQGAGLQGSLGQLALSQQMQPAELMAKIGALQTGLGTAYQNALIRGATAGLQAGTIEQNMRQGFDNAAYTQFMRGVNYPQEMLSQYAGLLNGATGQSRTTTSESPGPSGTSQAIGLGLTALSLLGGGGGSSTSGLSSLLSGWFADGGAVDGERMGYADGGDVAEDEDEAPVGLGALGLSQITAPPKIAAARGSSSPFDALVNASPRIAAAQPVKSPPTMAPAVSGGASPSAPSAPSAPPPPASASAPAAAASAPGPEASPQAGDQGDLRSAMLTAGLAMMGGSSPHAMVNIGNAGLAGVQAYKKAQDDRRAQAAAAAEMALKREASARDQQRVDLQAKQLLAQMEENRLSRARQAKIDEVEMPYKRAMTEKALAEAGKNEFADRVRNAEAVGLLPGTPAYQAFVLTGQMPKAETAKTSPQEQARIKSEQKRLDTYDAAASKGQELMVGVEMLEKMREDSWNGPVVGRAFGFLNSANQSVDAQASSLALDLVAKMKGNLSDKDVLFLKAQTPTTTMRDAAAAPVIAAMRAGALRAMERNSFMEEFYQRAGSLKGAETAWGKFVTENNVIGKDDKGSPIVLEGAISDWKKYLPKDPNEKAASPIDAARDAISKGAPRDKVIERLKQNGIDPSGL